MSSPCARGILNPLTSHAASLGGRGGRGGGPCPQRETSEDLSVPRPAPSLPGCPPSAPAPAWPGSWCPPSHLWPSARWRAGCEAGGRGEGGRLHGDTECVVCARLSGERAGAGRAWRGWRSRHGGPRCGPRVPRSVAPRGLEGAQERTACDTRDGGSADPGAPGVLHPGLPRRPGCGCPGDRVRSQAEGISETNPCLLGKTLSGVRVGVAVRAPAPSWRCALVSGGSWAWRGRPSSAAPIAPCTDAALGALTGPLASPS